MTRYTPEQTATFLEEEAKRTAEEEAAYYAWKRGETPLGTTPTYIPPEPSPPAPSAAANSDTAAKLDHPERAAGAGVHTFPGEGEFSEGIVKAMADRPGGETVRVETLKAMDIERDSTAGQTMHAQTQKSPYYGEDPLFRDWGDDPRPVTTQDNEGGYDLTKKESVDIDTLDLDDSSEEGRENKMKAMADELSGFSASQLAEAEIVEQERIKRGIEQGRKIMDHFGQRFEEAPPRRREK